MRQRGLSTVPAALLAAFAGLVAAVFLADWMIVDVHSPAPDDVHIKLPLPLVLADLALAVAPDDAFADQRLPAEVTAQRELVLAALASLEAAPDCTLVEVRDGSDHVTIAKVADELRLAVDDGEATVRMTLPISGLAEALARWDWQTVDPGVLVDVLHRTDSGNLLTVEADGARVALTMW